MKFVFGRRRAFAERDAARAEAAWRKAAMGEAKDALACGDGPSAYQALTRHERTTSAGGDEA